MTNKQKREKREHRRTNAQDWAKKQQRGGERTHVKLPEGIEEYKLEPGVHKIDFLPYLVGKNNKRADEGFEHFEREYAGHRIAGPDGRQRLYCCRYECFEQNCPACKLRNSREVDQEVAKSLQPTTRHLWLVNDQPGKLKNKPKVLDTGHFNRGMGFGELMADAINALGEGVNPFGLKGGYTATLTVKELTFPPNGKYNGVTRIDLRPRDYDYPEELLEKMPCLDDMLIDVGAGGMLKLLNQDEAEPEEEEERSSSSKPARARARDEDPGDEDEEEDEEETDEEDEEDESEEDDEPVKASKNGKPAKGKKAEPTAAEFGIKAGMEVEYRGSTWSVLKVSSDGTSLTLEDDEGEEKHGVGPEEVTLVKKGNKKPTKTDEDEEDERPAKVQKPGKKKPVAQDDDEEDKEDSDDDEDSGNEDEDEEDDALEEDEDDEDEVPTSRKPAKKSAKQ